MNNEFPHVILHNLGTKEGRNGFHQSLMDAPDNLGLKPWRSREPHQVIIEAEDAGILVNPAQSQLKELVEVRYYGSQKKNHSGPRLERIIGRLSTYEHGVVAERSYRRDHRFVHILPEPEFTDVFTSRNRPSISQKGQDFINQLTVAIAGLSVGAASADALSKGGVKHFRLADFDPLALSNFNRFPTADVGQIGVSKARVLAIGLLDRDPYTDIHAYEKFVGLKSDGQHVDIRTLLQGADVFIEAIDKLNLKVPFHEIAVMLKIFSIMATDLGYAASHTLNQPGNPVFSGRLTPIDKEYIAAHPKLTPPEFVHYAMKMIGPENIPQEFSRSLGKTPWLPQPGVAAQLSAALITTVIGLIAEHQTVKSDFAIDIRAAARQ